MTKSILEDIKKFFKQNDVKQKLLELIDIKCLKEGCLLNSIGFSNIQCLEKGKKISEGLFGWGAVKPDFEADKVVIECKYIKSGNECDIKNGLAQIIEQAIIKNVKQAILVVIDNGRLSHEDWNDKENKFIEMFKNNKFDINLSVVRVRVHDGKVFFNYVN